MARKYSIQWGFHCTSELETMIDLPSLTQNGLTHILLKLDILSFLQTSFEIIKGPFLPRDKGKYEMFSTLATVAYIK
jgi:hypothetical protein